ncbi:MAG: hypothetical protein ACREGK_07910 [Geminicoccales bacterium]
MGRWRSAARSAGKLEESFGEFKDLVKASVSSIAARAVDFPAPASTHARTLARLVRGKNIHGTTLLATDYLNHFNEIILLLELIPDMPEMIEEARSWRPRTYVKHFRGSGLADKELAIFAYENAPAQFRKPFDAAVAAIHELASLALARIESALEKGDLDRIAATIAEDSQRRRQLVDVAGAIIHGDHKAMDQAGIDAILGA